MPATPATPARSAIPEPPAPVELDAAAQARLLELARVAIAVAAGDRPAQALRAAVASDTLPALRAGAFVTLTRDGDLRGCMGTLDDTEPAWASVLRAARLATLGDPRFVAVERAELARLHVDVSILGPMVPLPNPARFRPGVEGVLVELDGRRGLLLPEVVDHLPPQQGAMLDAVCRKAGLPAGAWRDDPTALLVFRTCRFGGPVG